MPPVGHEEYAAAVRRELASGRYVTVLPSSDAALVALAAPGSDLVDKSLLADRAAAAGVRTVPSRTFASRDEVLAAVGDLEFPVVVKAAVKAARSPYPARRVDAAAGLVANLPDGRVVVQPWMAGPMSAVAGVMWKGELVAAAHQRYERIWPPGCGVASAAVSVVADTDVEERLVALLGGYDGIFQAQFVGGRLVDVNPRVYGSMPLATAAGANLVGVWCDLLRGGAPAPARARPGVRYRWLDGDVRALADDLRHRRYRPGRLLAELRPRAGTAYSVESLVDLRPAATRLWWVATHRR